VPLGAGEGRWRAQGDYELEAQTLNGAGKQKDIQDRIAQIQKQVEDALSATRTAIEEGIVPGGFGAII